MLTVFFDAKLTLFDGRVKSDVSMCVELRSAPRRYAGSADARGFDQGATVDYAVRLGPRPCSARASAVTGFAVFSTLNPEPRRLIYTLVNSAPRRRICAE